MAHVDLLVHPLDLAMRARAAAHPHASGERLGFLVRGSRCPLPRERDRSPTTRVVFDLAIPFLACPTPREVGRPQKPRQRSVQDERGDPFGMKRREEDAHRAALGHAHHRCARRARSVHHRSNVVDPRLQVRDPDCVRRARAALVEQDQAAPRRQCAKVARPRRVVPVAVDVRHPSGHVHEIERPVADDLVGDPDVPAARKARNRQTTPKSASTPPGAQRLTGRRVSVFWIGRRATSRRARGRPASAHMAQTVVGVT